jgi:hypothetical protein
MSSMRDYVHMYNAMIVDTKRVVLQGQGHSPETKIKQYYNRIQIQRTQLLILCNIHVN